MMEPSARVRLTVDLTRFLPGLVAGAHGVVAGPASAGGINSNHFVGVCFPGVGAVDIARESLEFLGVEAMNGDDGRSPTVSTDGSEARR